MVHAKKSDPAQSFAPFVFVTLYTPKAAWCDSLLTRHTRVEATSLVLMMLPISPGAPGRSRNSARHVMRKFIVFPESKARTRFASMVQDSRK